MSGHVQQNRVGYKKLLEEKEMNGEIYTSQEIQAEIDRLEVNDNISDLLYKDRTQEIKELLDDNN